MLEQEIIDVRSKSQFGGERNRISTHSSVEILHSAVRKWFTDTYLSVTWYRLARFRWIELS